MRQDLGRCLPPRTGPPTAGQSLDYSGVTRVKVLGYGKPTRRLLGSRCLSSLRRWWAGSPGSRSALGSPCAHPVWNHVSSQHSLVLMYNLPSGRPPW